MRRYPRLTAYDQGGRLVIIPLSIAPLLLPRDEFISLSQQKVYEIAEANERLKRQEDVEPTPKQLPVKKRETDSIPDGEAERSKDDSSTEISVPSSSKRSRFWSREEDEIVLSAVLMKEPGKNLLERLPHRSKSAVLQRFYMIREKHHNGMKADADDDMGEIPPL